MPTGIPITGVREQLSEAAERVLLRDGPSGVTSRAVTTEAGVAKGMLHSHFPDFDTFLASLVLSHIERIESLGEELRDLAGNAAVQDNLLRAIGEALAPPVMALVSLVISRHELLDRLRLTTPTGIPLLTETTRIIAGYLTAERGLGRVPLATDVDMLAVLLVGGAQLLASEQGPGPGKLSSLVGAATGA